MTDSLDYESGAAPLGFFEVITRWQGEDEEELLNEYLLATDIYDAFSMATEIVQIINDESSPEDQVTLGGVVLLSPEVNITGAALDRLTGFAATDAALWLPMKEVQA